MTTSTIEKVKLPPETVGFSSCKKTCVEYFAGMGLVRLGLERTGWQVVFANDWSSEKFDMYRAYFEDAEKHYSVGDIFGIQPSSVPETLLATVSFPCIDLSLAGSLKGIRGNYSGAFWGFIAILKGQKDSPPLILLENVPGWLTSNGGKDFRLTIQALNDSGYACDVFVINATHFVPQSRRRVFVVGSQISEPNNDILRLARRSKSLRTKAVDRAIAANHDLAWHFLDIPELPKQSQLSLSDIVEDIPLSDQRWWNKAEVERHIAMMSATNLTHLEALKMQPACSYRTMYRRVRHGQQRAEIRKDNIAGCLRTAKGGSSRQMLVSVGKGRIDMRLVTPRECARLQGVPDSYPLPEKVNQALTGLGDAVCVPVITWIGENVLNPAIAGMLNR